MEITTFTNLFNTRGVRQTCTPPMLAKALTAPMPNRGAKQNIPLWSPTTFNGTRAKSNAVDIWALVFDMDDGLTGFDSWRMFGDWQVIAHTSYSHKPYHHKYRIVLPLAKPVPARDWDRASTAANELWAHVVGRGIPDQSAIHDNARAYYRYSLPDSIDGPNHPMHPKHWHQTAVHLEAPQLVLEYGHIKQAAPRHVAKPRPTKLRGSSVKTRDMAMMDPEVRSKVANAVGASIQGNTARQIECPQCGKREVYFSIDPTMVGAVVWPRCNRQDKCQWFGTFDRLLGE